MPAIDQREFLAAVIGEQSDLGKLPAGYFTVGSKMANMAGLEVLSGPRDVAKAKRLVAESGYKGEPVLLMSPTDQPALAQVTQVTRDVFEKVGIKVEASPGNEGQHGGRDLPFAKIDSLNIRNFDGSLRTSLGHILVLACRPA